MNDMTPAHAKPARRDLLWVLVLILACGLLEVWASWLQIGAVSGFPKLGGMTTGWILPVTSEAYWGAALFAWLAAPAGPRSKRFAMWSAAAVFLLSLCGQESDHLLAAAGRTVPPVGVVGFVTALPLIAVALIAVLIHLRHLDRDEAERAGEAQRTAQREAAEAAAAADERTALRAELEAARAERDEAHAEMATARTELARTAGKVAALERKLEAQKPKRARTGASGARRAKAPGAASGATARTMLPDDFDARTQALEIWLANPQISGKDLGEAVGMKERWGQLRKNEFAAAAPADPQARSEP